MGNMEETEDKLACLRAVREQLCNELQDSRGEEDVSTTGQFSVMTEAQVGELCADSPEFSSEESHCMILSESLALLKEEHLELAEAHAAQERLNDELRERNESLQTARGCLDTRVLQTVLSLAKSSSNAPSSTECALNGLLSRCSKQSTEDHSEASLGGDSILQQRVHRSEAQVTVLERILDGERHFEEAAAESLACGVLSVDLNNVVASPTRWQAVSSSALRPAARLSSPMAQPLLRPRAPAQTQSLPQPLMPPLASSPQQRSRSPEVARLFTRKDAEPRPKSQPRSPEVARLFTPKDAEPRSKSQPRSPEVARLFSRQEAEPRSKSQPRSPEVARLFTCKDAEPRHSCEESHTASHCLSSIPAVSSGTEDAPPRRSSKKHRKPKADNNLKTIARRERMSHRSRDKFTNGDLRTAAHSSGFNLATMEIGFSPPAKTSSLAASTSPMIQVSVRNHIASDSSLSCQPMLPSTPAPTARRALNSPSAPLVLQPEADEESRGVHSPTNISELIQALGTLRSAEQGRQCAEIEEGNDRLRSEILVLRQKATRGRLRNRLLAIPEQAFESASASIAT